MRKKITKRVVDGLESSGQRPIFLWDTETTGFGCKVTPAGKKVYILQYRRPGQGGKSAPKRLTLGKHGHLTPDQAREIATRLLLELRSGSDPATVLRVGESPTVSELVEKFLTEYLPSKKRPPGARTIRFYESHFRCHVIPRLGKRRVDSVVTAEIEELHRSMSRTPYMANRVLTVLHHAFDQAERWGWRPQRSNPALHIDRYPEERRGSKKEVMLTAQQMARLLEAIDTEERNGMSGIACAAIRVAFWTGWRIGEVLSLEWSNVDLEKGSAKLLRTKTSEEEYRQLPAEAIDVLANTPRFEGGRYVFPGDDLRRHLTSVTKHWSRIRVRAGLDDLDGLGAFRLHDLRHNVVSWDVSRGVALEIAGKNVGHRSRQATEIYAHFAPDALKRAADDRARAMRKAVEETQLSVDS